MQPFALCLGNQHLSTLIQLVRQLAPIAIVPQEKALNDVPSIERRTEEWKPRTLVFGPLPAISVNSLGKVKKVLTWPEDKHNHHRSHCSGQLQLWRQCNKIGKVGEGVSENGDVRKLLCVCMCDYCRLSIYTVWQFWLIYAIAGRARFPWKNPPFKRRPCKPAGFQCRAKNRNRKRRIEHKVHTGHRRTRWLARQTKYKIKAVSWNPSWNN